MALSFLLAKEAPRHGGTSFYRFVPYGAGPYSFMLLHDLSVLERKGYVRCVGHCISRVDAVCESETRYRPLNPQGDVAWTMRRYGRMSSGSLHRYVSNKFPEFAVGVDSVGLSPVVRPLAMPLVYTLGYERLSIDGCIEILIRTGIRRLIDVRSNPISRQYGFHKRSLMSVCRQVAIEYDHFPELGIPSSLRMNAASGETRKELLKAYAADLDSRGEAITRVAEAIVETPSVLLCLEADPSQCHRFPLSRRLALVTNLRVEHLGWPR